MHVRCAYNITTMIKLKKFGSHLGVSPSAAGVGGRGHGVCVFLLERLSRTPWTTSAAAGAANHVSSFTLLNAMVIQFTYGA